MIMTILIIKKVHFSYYKVYNILDLVWFGTFCRFEKRAFKNER